ncbi:MAG TPA: PKD domain-containing protein [Candidatus Saccharimonadales bacterium]|nr:PKD domain-containing protein [Candidatus Saccharimonadales bacterium]
MTERQNHVRNLWQFAAASKIVIGGLSVLLLGGVLGWSALLGHAHQVSAMTADCNDNAVIRCGFSDSSASSAVTAFTAAYKANKSGDLDNIYANYGFTSGDLSKLQANAKLGYVTKSGDVVLNGKVIATGSTSIGRQDISGSSTKTINGKKYFERPTSVSFTTDKIPALIMMNGSKIDFIVLASCGNPVKATPKPTTTPKPTPKPSPTPVASAMCSALHATLRTGTRDTYNYTVTNTLTGGAKALSYSFDFGDGTSPQVTLQGSTSHTYANAGNWKTRVTVQFSIASQNQVCEAETPVQAPPQATQASVTTPTTPAPAQQLPATGLENVAGGMFGTSALAGAGYYWRVSRKGLIARLLRR